MNFLKRIYRYFFPKKEEIVQNMPKEEEDSIYKFNYPKSYNKSIYSLDVIIYSYYLKSVGAEQKLSYGDWYAVGSELDGVSTGMPQVKLYTRQDDGLEGYDDFEFLSNGKYIRIVSIEEALTVIRTFGYNYSESNSISIDKYGQTVLSLENPKMQLAFVAGSTNAHAAHLKAAFLIASQSKALCEANGNLSKLNIFKLKGMSEDED